MPRLVKVVHSFCWTCLRPVWVARFLTGVFMFFIFFSSLALASTARAEIPASGPGRSLAQGAAGGKAIFDEKCAACHTIGAGKLIGPDLKDVTQLRDLQWIKDFILDPAKMIASDPVAQQLLKEYNNLTMPTLGLTPDQVDQVVEYLSNPGAAPAGPAVPTTAGDPIAGSQNFTGELALTNGGPACISCHSVSGTGILGGGGLGPDLTQVAQRLGAPGLSSALKAIPYPTMLGPFQNRLLTPKEQADLVAFFNEANQQQSPVPVVTAGALTRYVWLILGIGLVGAGLLFGLLLFFWIPLKKRMALRLPIRKV